MGASSAGDNDAARRLDIARALHAESVRALETQRAAVDGARSRAATVMAAAALVATFLGARAFEEAPIWAAIVGVLLLVGSGAAVVWTLLPWKFSWACNISELEEDYLGISTPGEPHSADRFFSHMARISQGLRGSNSHSVSRVQNGFVVATGFLAAQVVWWVIVLLAVGSPAAACKEVVVGGAVKLAEVCDAQNVDAVTSEPSSTVTPAARPKPTTTAPAPSTSR